MTSIERNVRVFFFDNSDNWNSDCFLIWKCFDSSDTRCFKNSLNFNVFKTSVDFQQRRKKLTDIVVVHAGVMIFVVIIKFESLVTNLKKIASLSTKVFYPNDQWVEDVAIAHAAQFLTNSLALYYQGLILSTTVTPLTLIVNSRLRSHVLWFIGIWYSRFTAPNFLLGNHCKPVDNNNNN